MEKAGGYHTPSLQGVPHIEVGKPPLAHDFSCRYGCHHYPLGGSGSRGVGSPRGHPVVDASPGGVFLCQICYYCINAGKTATTGL